MCDMIILYYDREQAIYSPSIGNVFQRCSEHDKGGRQGKSPYDIDTLVFPDVHVRRKTMVIQQRAYQRMSKRSFTNGEQDTDWSLSRKGEAT